MTRISAGFWAGLIAITVSTIILRLAEPLGIQAGGGALLRFATLVLGPVIEGLGIDGVWTATGLPAPSSMSFRLAFRFLAGFGMVFLYVFALERVLPGNGLVKGVLFSFLPWLVAGLVVMPILGEGVFGLRQIPVSGATYFFAANLSLGVVLGVLYERFRGSGDERSG